MTSAARSSVGTYAIPQDEFKELVAYTRTDTFAAKRDRTAEFFRADKTQEVTLRLLKDGGKLTAGLTIGGALLGAPAGPKGMLIGGAVGLGAGLVTTAIIGGVVLHRDYEDWKSSIEGKTVIDKFVQVRDNLPAFQGLTCSISKDIIKDPVQTMCGHTFERVYIEEYYDRNARTEGGPKCPDCRRVFNKTQLTTDITYVGKVKKTYANVLKNEMKNPEFTPAIVRGFESIYKGLDFQAAEILKQVSTDLTIQLNNGDLTPQAYSRKMREVTEIFSEEIEDPVLSVDPLVAK